MQIFIFLLSISFVFYPLELFSMRVQRMFSTADAVPTRSHSRSTQTTDAQNGQNHDNENRESENQADQDEIILV
jgi:hypothetical protein